MKKVSGFICFLLILVGFVGVQAVYAKDVTHTLKSSVTGKQVDVVYKNVIGEIENATYSKDVDTEETGKIYVMEYVPRSDYSEGEKYGMTGMPYAPSDYFDIRNNYLDTLRFDPVTYDLGVVMYYEEYGFFDAYCVNSCLCQDVLILKKGESVTPFIPMLGEGGIYICQYKLLVNDSKAEPFSPENPDDFTTVNWRSAEEYDIAAHAFVVIPKGFDVNKIAENANPFVDLKSIKFYDGQGVQTPAPPIKVLHNGSELSFDFPIINKDGRTYYPLRELIEGIGGTVEWNAETKSAVGKLNNNSVEFIVGSDKYMVNGRVLSMDAAAFIDNDKTYIPIRYACEGLGLNVVWDENANTITLTSKNT